MAGLDTTQRELGAIDLNRNGILTEQAVAHDAQPRAWQESQLLEPLGHIVCTGTEARLGLKANHPGPLTPGK